MGKSAKLYFHDGFDYLQHGRLATIVCAVFSSLALLMFTKVSYGKYLWLVPVLFLLDPYVTSVMSSAMEQCLFVFLGTIGLVLLIYGLKKSMWYVPLCVLFFAAQFTVRPEALAFFLVAVLYIVYSRRYALAVIFLFSAGIIMIPLLVFLKSLFGTMLPQSLLVKTADTRGHLPFTDLYTMKYFLKMALQVYAPPLVVVLVLYLWQFGTNVKKLITDNLLPVAIVTALFIAYLGFLKERAVSSRYLVNFTPFLLAIIAYMIESLNKPLVKRLATIAVIMIFIALNILSIPVRVSRGMRLEPPRIEVGRYLKENTPEEASVYVHDIGYIGFYSDRKIYDFNLIEAPRQNENIGLLKRKKNVDLCRLFRDCDIDYVVGGVPESCGIELELVYTTKSPHQKTEMCVFRILK